MKNTNRRRRLENNVPVRDFSPWFLLLVLVALGGFTWVYYRNQIFQRGETIGKMEKELVELGRKNEALRGRVAQLSTIAALQKRCQDMAIKMDKISLENIVTLPLPARNVADVEMDSNPFAAR